MDQLPVELIEKILANISILDYFNTAIVSKSFHKIVSGKSFKKTWIHYKLFAVLKRHQSADANHKINIAAEHGNLEMVKYYAEVKGANVFHFALMRIYDTDNIPLIEYLVDKVDCDVNSGLYNSIKFGNTVIAQYYIDKGANNWNWGMLGAAECGSVRLVSHFANLGATNYKQCMNRAAFAGYPEVVRFLKKRKLGSR